MTDRVLLAGDVDAIREFVFETSSLPQIRGGSELLLECEQEIREDVKTTHGYEVIYCSGGSFLLEAPAEKAEEIKQTVEHLYLNRTRVATVTIVCEESLPAKTLVTQADGWAGRILKAAEDAVTKGEFSHRVFALGARMRVAKTQKSHAPFYETFPFGRRCDRCGKRMAAYIDPVEPEKRLCSVCEKRDSKGRRRNQEIRGRFNQAFWDIYKKDDYSAEQPKDLDTLVQEAKRDYLAFLYADGNDIGRLLQKAENPEHYRAISEALCEGTKEALFDAVATVCGPTLQKRTYWPFDIINIGGDDVTVLIQAGYAWELAVKFLERFQEEVNGRLQNRLGGSWPPVTASCGIVIADVKYPMRYFERLADDLLKQAKRLAKKDPNHPTSALTFLWLPSPVASEKAEPLMGYYNRHYPEKMWLTARPYDLERARALLEETRKIAQWPRTLRHRWVEVLERGVMVSVNAIHYDIARRSEEKRREMYETLARVGKLAVPDGAPTDIPAPIWYLKEGTEVWQTALLDTLELAELQALRPDVEEETE